MERMIFMLLAGIMAMGVVFGFIGSRVGGTFTDLEPSDNNALVAAISWTELTTLLDDGFEGEPWDANWDGNGTTTWSRVSDQVHSVTYSAYCDRDTNGLLTTDDLDASGAASITVSFWYRPHALDPTDMLVQLYNGTTYNTWYDIANYSSYVVDQWCYFSEVMTDSQYFKANFRLRFDSSQLGGNETFYADDVLITTE